MRFFYFVKMFLFVCTVIDVNDIDGIYLFNYEKKKINDRLKILVLFEIQTQ